MKDSGETLVLNLHNIGCRNQCLFCGKVPYLSEVEMKKVACEQIEKLEILKTNNNITRINISGNDPVEYFDFVGFLKDIKAKTDLDVSLQSHCMNFADKKFLEEVLVVGNLKIIEVPIYGHNAKVHDEVTGASGSFDMVITALDNLRESDFDGEIKLHTLFTKQCEDCQLELLEFLLAYDLKTDASLPCIPGFKNEYKDRRLGSVPDLEKVRSFFASKEFDELNTNNFYVYDMPFCLINEFKNYGFCNWSSIGSYDHFEGQKFDQQKVGGEIYPDYRILAKKDECAECICNEACQGITKPYVNLDKFEVRPIKNSKNKDGKVKKSVIFTSYHCNNQCVFCIDADKRGIKPRTSQEIRNEMMMARDRGTTYLELIGGEVTIRPDSIELIAFAKRLGFETISLTTNGRMLSYKEYAKNIVEAGLTDIVFSIHGHNAELHDSLTQVEGSFNQMMMGYDNLRELGFKNIGSNTTIVKQNFEQLPLVGEFIYDIGIRNAEFIFVDPNYGAAKNNFNELVPDVSKVVPYVKKCLDIKQGDKNISHWHIRYMPLCHLGDYLDQISEIDEVSKFQTEHLASDFQNFDSEGSRAEIGRVKSEVCKKCKLNNICEGIWMEYGERRGLDELEAPDTSFDFDPKMANELKELSGIGCQSFLQLAMGLKSVVRIGVNGQDIKKLEEFCRENDLFCEEKRMERLNSDLHDDSVLYLAFEERYIEELYEAEMNEDVALIGKLFGYPRCCVAKFKESLEYGGSIENDRTLIREGSFYCNNIFNFDSRVRTDEVDEFKKSYEYIKNVDDLYLVKHVPCSCNCEESIEVGRKTLEMMKVYFPELSNKVEEALRNKFLCFDKFNWICLDATMREGRFFYENIFDKLTCCDATLLDRFKGGDSFALSESEIKIFKDEEEVFVLDKSGRGNGYLIDFK